MLNIKEGSTMGNKKPIRLSKNSSGFNIRTKTEKVILAIFFVLYCAYAVTLFFPIIWTLYSLMKKAT